MIDITRHYDAVLANEVLNHPKVRPWVADAAEGVLDISAQVNNRANILLMGEYGGCLFLALSFGMYEVHTFFLPGHPREWSTNFLWGVGLWMFTRSPAVEVLTRVPHGHLAAKTAALSAGMHMAWTRPKCRFRGQDVPVDILSSKVHDWVWEAPWLEEMGAAFHEDINRQALALGITSPPHDDDPNHNRIVGLCVEMFKHGQAAKATALYSRWAAASRHAGIELLQVEPPVVRFDAGLLTIEHGEVKMSRAS